MRWVQVFIYELKTTYNILKYAHNRMIFLALSENPHFLIDNDL
jgi:hypothetical protein